MKEFEQAIKGLKGFTTDIKAGDSLAIAVHGLQGAGKSRFACTFPDPIGYIALDRKARRTVERVSKELGKTVVMPVEDFVRVSNPIQLANMKLDVAMAFYRNHVDTVKQAIYKMVPAVKSIVIDTGSQLFEDMMFAHYGRAQRIMPRDRGELNQEMIDLLNFLSVRNLCIIHKSREIWKNDKPTGKFEIQGFRHIGYHVNVIAELACDDKKEPGDDRFVMNVEMCQDNPDIQGPGGKKLLTDDNINFQNLAMLIYPDSDPSDWE